MAEPYVIVWDLDGTLGCFDALNNRAECADPIDVQVRPHLRECLQTLTDAGFLHTLLTLSTPLYAEIVLAGLDIRHYFERVEGYGQRGKGDVDGLGDLFAIAKARRGERMVFIGDHPLYDEPRDPAVVFHLECFALQRSARDAALLVRGLREMGNGSLCAGFEKLSREPGWFSGLFRRGVPFNTPLRRALPGLDPLLLVRREEQAPVIAFAEAPQTAVDLVSHPIIPAALTPAVRARMLENERARQHP